MEGKNTNQFVITVNYTVGSATVPISFNARAKNEQFVKEQYHRYTHENYKKDVDRSHEDDHIHGIGETLVSSIESIKPVDNPVPGLMPITHV